MSTIVKHPGVEMKDKTVAVTCKEAREMMAKFEQILIHWRPEGILNHKEADSDRALVTVFG
jgi:hypothetical protein